MDFAFFAGVPEKPSQCFLKLLPSELACLRKSSRLGGSFRGQAVAAFHVLSCKHPWVFHNVNNVASAMS